MPRNCARQHPFEQPTLGGTKFLKVKPYMPVALGGTRFLNAKPYMLVLRTGPYSPPLHACRLRLLKITTCIPVLMDGADALSPIPEHGGCMLLALPRISSKGCGHKAFCCSATEGLRDACDPLALEPVSVSPGSVHTEAGLSGRADISPLHGICMDYDPKCTHNVKAG